MMVGMDMMSQIYHKIHQMISIIQDSSGKYWLGSDTGIMILHGDSHTYYNIKNGLPDNGISRLMQDREGNIWSPVAAHTEWKSIARRILPSTRIRPCTVSWDVHLARSQKIVNIMFDSLNRSRVSRGSVTTRAAAARR